MMFQRTYFKSLAPYLNSYITLSITLQVNHPPSFGIHTRLVLKIPEEVYANREAFNRVNEALQNVEWRAYSHPVYFSI